MYAVVDYRAVIMYALDSLHLCLSYNAVHRSQNFSPLYPARTAVLRFTTCRYRLVSACWTDTNAGFAARPTLVIYRADDCALVAWTFNLACRLVLDSCRLPGYSALNRLLQDRHDTAAAACSAGSPAVLQTLFVSPLLPFSATFCYHRTVSHNLP